MSDIQSAAQAAAEVGGSYTIAGAIIYATAKLGPILARHLPALVQLLYAIWEQREVRLEQEERRSRRRRRGDSSLPPMSAARHSTMPSVDAAPEFVAEESTGLTDVRETVRKRAPGGLRLPRPGTHHDGKD